ncbi:MAG: DUF1566 domain-containing protein [Tatlockia sp.]|nr:DUF1566 domain-containing protein [Tatlockia sp.]
MKIKSLLLLLLFSNVLHANPNTDIWDYAKNLALLIVENKKDIKLLQQAIKNQTTYTAGEGIAIENGVIKAQPTGHHIGDEYRGGIVFYIDESGQHGLIASKIDSNEEGIQWRNGASGNKVTNARGDGIGAGVTNTRLIIAQQTIDNQKGVFAALMASNFQVAEDGQTPCKTPISSEQLCYGGWHLPSAFELQLMYKNLHQKGLSLFAPDFYWSSTEASVANAWLQNFSTGDISASSKSNTVGRVRAISQF